MTARSLYCSFQSCVATNTWSHLWLSKVHTLALREASALLESTDKLRTEEEGLTSMFDGTLVENLGMPSWFLVSTARSRCFWDLRGFFGFSSDAYNFHIQVLDTKNGCFTNYYATTANGSVVNCHVPYAGEHLDEC